MLQQKTPSSNFQSIALLVIAMLLFSDAHAGLQEDFADLKNRGRNLSDTGAICEELAQLNFERIYGNGFKVLTGIEYSDDDGVLGELDVIVFDKTSTHVVLISEVKCWRNLAGGFQKAREQRARFLQALNSKRPITFRWKEDASVQFSKNQFVGIKEFKTVAQKGSLKFGFDIEFAYELSELMDLREMISRCQYSGSCRRPRH